MCTIQKSIGPVITCIGSNTHKYWTQYFSDYKKTPPANLDMRALSKTRDECNEYWRTAENTRAFMNDFVCDFAVALVEACDFAKSK